MFRLITAFACLCLATYFAPAAPVAWFKGDGITNVASGAGLATWPDASGNGYHASQAVAGRRPTFVTGAINGQPVVHFTATNRTLLHFVRPVQNNFTLLVVFRSTQGVGSGANFYQGAGLLSGDVGNVANDFGSCLFANGQVCAGTGNPDVSVLSAGGYNDSRPHLMTFKRSKDSGEIALYLDGLLVEKRTGCTNSLTAPYSLVLGAQDAGQKHFEGDLAEVKVFRTALSDPERQAEEMELRNKYAIMPTGLATWFKADAITNVAHGATLATWQDASGHTNHATQTTGSRQPTYVTNALNGSPAVHFSAGRSTSLNFNRPVSNDFTIIGVFRSTQGLGAGTYFYEGAGLVSGEVYGVVNDFGTCVFANGQVCAGTGRPEVAVRSANGYNDGRPHVFTFRRTQNTGALVLYVDGILAGTATGSTEALTAPIRLMLGAQQASGANNFEGDLAEVQIFSRALSDLDRQTQEVGLMTKYGVIPPGLVAWFKPEALNGLNNGAVLATWPDASGRSNNAIQSAVSQRPTYVANALNGLPVVRFNATNDTCLKFDRPADEDLAIVGVFRSSQGLAAGTLYWQGAGLVSGEVYGYVYDYGVCLFANGQVCAGTGNRYPDIDTAILSTSGYNDGQAHVFTFTRVKGSGQIALYLDGVPAGIYAGSREALTAPEQLALGAQQPGYNFFQGDLAEVQIYRHALSDQERQTTEGGLGLKYAIRPPAPAGLSAAWQNNRVALVWPDSSLATYYVVKRATNLAGPFTLIGMTTAATFADTNVVNGVPYCYEVAGANASGQGPSSPRAGVPGIVGMLSSGPVRLTLRTNAGGYHVALQLTNDATFYEQPHPMAVEVINTWSNKWWQTAPYTSVEVSGGVFQCSGTILSTNGSRFSFTDRYQALDNHGMIGIDRTVVVTAAASGDLGFSTRLAFQRLAPGTMQDYDFFMPGVWYGHNEDFKAGSIAKDESAYYYWVREDRLPLPLFMLRQKDNGATFAVAHINPDGASYTNENGTDLIVDGRLQFAAIGMQDNQRPLVGVLYPGTEGQITYIYGNNKPFALRAHPVVANFTQRYSLALRLSMQPSFLTARVDTWTNFYRLYNPTIYACDLNQIYAVGTNLLDSYWTKIDGVAGLPFQIPLSGIITNTNDYCFQIGFTGRQTCNGAIMVRAGLLSDNAALRSKGEQILDFWADNSLMPAGPPRTWYNATAIPPAWRHDQTWIRIATDGFLGLLWGWNYENQKGVFKTSWSNACIRFGDWILSQQAADGSIPRCWDYQTGEVTDADTYNTSHVVHYLAELYLATGIERYRAAALAAGEFIYTDTYVPQRYLGGTSGSWTRTVPDKEAASMALRAFLALYDLTREPRWLDAAVQAAHYYATWIYSWHVPLPADDTELVYPANRLTTGLSLVASDTIAADSYAAADAFQVYRLYLFTGDPQLLKEAALMLYNTKQGLHWNLADPIPGFGNGIMNEALQLVPPRGHGVGYHLPWQTANYMEALISFQDVFGTYDLGGSEQHSLAEQQAKNHAFALRRNYWALQAAPGAPGGLTATPGVGQIRLAWNGSPDTPYYILKRSMSSDGPYVPLVSQSATNFTDTTVTNEIPCFYVVSALGAGGESTNSAPVSATAHPPPRVTAGLSGAGDRLVLAWPGWANTFEVAIATNLAPPIFWTPLTNLPYVSNETFFLELPAGGRGQEYFRLRLGD